MLPLDRFGTFHCFVDSFIVMNIIEAKVSALKDKAKILN